MNKDALLPAQLIKSMDALNDLADGQLAVPMTKPNHPSREDIIRATSGCIRQYMKQNK